MNIFEFMKATRTPVLDLDFALIEDALSKSTGNESMSPEDMKLAILGLHGIVKTQRDMIAKLYEVLAALEIDETPKPKRRWFKK